MMTNLVIQCFVENKSSKVWNVEFTADDYHVAMPQAPSHPYQFLSNVSIFNVFCPFCDNEHAIFKSALVILKDEFEFNQEENNLDATNNRKSSEETHGASNKAELGIKFDLLVPCYLLKGCRVKAIS